MIRTFPCLRAVAAALICGAVLAGCQRTDSVASAPGGAPAPAPLTDAGPTTSVAHVEGIEWFEGGIDAAFAAAAAQDKPVFLYWGAEWCPPCYDLKAHVFPRADFQRTLRQFVAVYLDGDAPGAQRIAGQFRVQGYPSVVVLKADRTELARISGGSDLASYAEVLSLALENMQPVDTLLASVEEEGSADLDAAACRRLAWNDWSLWTEDELRLARALQRAAEACPEAAQAERDRLRVTAADVAAAAGRAGIESGKPASALLTGLLRSVGEVLADPRRSLAAGTALLYLDEDFFIVSRHLDPQGVATLRQHYFRLLDDFERDTAQSETARLLTAARRLQAAKALHHAQQVAPEVAARARATLDAFLQRDYDPNARAGIVNSASWVLYELGDDARLRALLEEQMRTARTPYYYMPDIADIEERAGNSDAALQWLERGYREARGPATRFQWGTLYVNGLLRMTPADVPRIRNAVLDVIGELDGADRIHARARERLERLDASLQQWAEDETREEALGAIFARWQGICAGLPPTDPARASCRQLMSEPAAT